MSTNALSDFSRLHKGLPERISERNLQHARQNTLLFYETIKTDEEFEWPLSIKDINREIRFYLSSVIDRAVLQVYNEAVHQIQKTPEHKANFRALRDAPINCGGFKTANAILPHANSFEQMVTLDHVIDRYAPDWPVGRRTYCFKYVETQVVPLYVASSRNCKASVMTTTLGAAKGPYKVPTYEQLAESDWDANYSIFIKPLEFLEYVRQPHFGGASLLKANAFDNGLIDHRRRYKVETSRGKPSIFACVEFKGQKKPQPAPLKERSAGSNMLFLEKTSPKKELAGTLNFEDWSDEGYKDEVDTSVKVHQY
jgi:hypothetical protein